MLEPFNQDWDRHHHSFSADMGRLLDTLGQSFRRLVAIQYDAPWERTLRPRRHRNGRA